MSYKKGVAMKILVVSHSCVVDVNQQLLQSLCLLPETEVLLVSPANWISDVTGQSLTPQNLTNALFSVIRPSVLFPGKINLHFYTQFPTRSILEFAPDIVYSTQEPFCPSNYQALTFARKHNLPFVFHTNQNILKSYPPPFSWMESQSLQYAKYALAFSQEALNVMERKGRSKPSAVVPYATDVSRFRPSETDKAEVRLQYGIMSKAIVFGYIGRFVPEKGLADLIDASAILLNSSPGFGELIKILLIGSGSEEPKLRAQAMNLGIEDRLVFTGVVPHSDAARYMNAIDVLVLPSRTLPNWKEQFGRVIVEAMACHVPVIGSDSGEIPNLIRETGGGTIYHEGDCKELAERMLYIG
ncbi:MAG: glycosyltransferase, partial [Armatimonadota bacterium]